jgi:hypothetical protein
MTLLSDARKMFNVMYKFHDVENLNDLNIVLKTDAFRVLDGIEFLLQHVLQNTERNGREFSSESMREEAIRQFKVMLKFVKKTKIDLEYIAILKCLYLYLELYYGAKAQKKGAQAYAKFRQEWHADKYAHLRLKGLHNTF